MIGKKSLRLSRKLLLSGLLTLVIDPLAYAGSTAVPAVTESEKVGVPGASLRLAKLDKEVQRYGVDSNYNRMVVYSYGIGVRATPEELKSAPYALVEYWHRSDLGEIARGVEVWFKRDSESYIIVPKSVIRAAQAAATNAGVDLSRYSRTVEREGENFVIVYSARRVVSQGLLDGTIAVKVDGKSRRSIGVFRR